MHQIFMNFASGIKCHEIKYPEKFSLPGKY